MFDCKWSKTWGSVIIITDIRMPKGDGVELLLNVRKNSKDFPPIIMMTGFSIHNEQSLLDKGADLVLKKPFEVDYLLKKVEEFLKEEAQSKVS